MRWEVSWSQGQQTWQSKDQVQEGYGLTRLMLLQVGLLHTALLRNIWAHPADMRAILHCEDSLQSSWVNLQEITSYTYLI